MNLLDGESSPSLSQMAKKQGFRSLKLTSVDADQPLGGDPVGVTFGRLDNGLTYYVRSNSKPRMRAALALAVKAGFAIFILYSSLSLSIAISLTDSSELRRGSQVGAGGGRRARRRAHRRTPRVQRHGEVHKPRHRQVSRERRSRVRTVSERRHFRWRHCLRAVLAGRQARPVVSGHLCSGRVQHRGRATLDSCVLFSFVAIWLIVQLIWFRWSFAWLQYKVRVSKEDLDKERGAVMEEYRGTRNASGRMQDANWALMMEGSKVLLLVECECDIAYKFLRIEWGVIVRIRASILT